MPPDSTCRACIELLLDGVAAGNRVVEIERRQECATARWQAARARQAEARRRLWEYQRQRQCRCHCPNRASNPPLSIPRA